MQVPTTQSPTGRTLTLVLRDDQVERVVDVLRMVVGIEEMEGHVLTADQDCRLCQEIV